MYFISSTIKPRVNINYFDRQSNCWLIEGYISRYFAKLIADYLDSTKHTYQRYIYLDLSDKSEVKSAIRTIRCQR